MSTVKRVQGAKAADDDLTPFDWLVWDLCRYLDAADTDDAGKLRALGMLAATFARDALAGETGAMRDAREALKDAAAGFVDAALKAQAGGEG